MNAQLLSSNDLEIAAAIENGTTGSYIPNGEGARAKRINGLIDATGDGSFIRI